MVAPVAVVDLAAARAALAAVVMTALPARPPAMADHRRAGAMARWTRLRLLRNRGVR